jgi:hypothetical protein
MMDLLGGSNTGQIRVQLIAEWPLPTDKVIFYHMSSKGSGLFQTEPATVGFVNRDGYKLNYEIHGSGDKKVFKTNTRSDVAYGRSLLLWASELVWVFGQA